MSDTKKPVIVEHRYAWFPVFIRNYVPGIGHVGSHFTWFKKYTVVKALDENGKYKTITSFLGWRD